MTVRFGEPIKRDPRRYDQSTLRPEEAKAIGDLLKVDTNQIRTRGFHASYLLLLAIALQHHAESELKGSQEKEIT